MTGDGPRTGPRHEPDRIYERAPDPAEAVNRPLEPKAPGDELKAEDVPDERPPEGEGDGHPPQDPHHRLNTRIGEPDPTADSDPYRDRDEQQEDDRASGTTGIGQGAER
jgi:hypothetical protein